jgi:hypothetical protein
MLFHQGIVRRRVGIAHDSNVGIAITLRNEDLITCVGWVEPRNREPFASK